MIKNYVVNAVFLDHGVIRSINSLEGDHSIVEFVVDTKKVELGNVIKIKLIPNHSIELIELNVKCQYNYNADAKIYANGYQSWTDSREFFKTEKINKPSAIFKIANKFSPIDRSGDYRFYNYSNKIGEFHSFSYTYITEKKGINLLGSLSERQGYTIFQHYANDNQLTIVKDCSGHKIKSEYDAFQLLDITGEYDKVFDCYFDVLNIKKPRKTRATGYTSWYNHYQDINETIILDNLKASVNCGTKLDIFQIDDGYQTKIGDWLDVDATKFPNGMKTIADKIKANGMTAGIWIAPFAVQFGSRIAKEHPDWLVKEPNGKPLIGGNNWMGFYVLDIYKEEPRQYIRHFFDVILNEWGYDLVKLDFLYAICINTMYNKTRGQIMTEAMEFIRECCGDKLILGCGVPLFPTFGLVDFCRIGTDISLDWNTSFFGRRIHRENVSTKNAIGNSIFRRHLDGRAFVGDPDVFLLRDYNIKMTVEQKHLLAKINTMFGNLLFTSDNMSDYNDEQKDMFLATVEENKTVILSATYSTVNKLLIKYLEDGKEKTMHIDMQSGTII